MRTDISSHKISFSIQVDKTEQWMYCTGARCILRTNFRIISVCVLFVVVFKQKLMSNEVTIFSVVPKIYAIFQNSKSCMDVAD